MTVHVLSGLHWKSVATGNWFLSGHLFLMYIVCQFFLPVPPLVQLMCRQFRWKWERMCVASSSSLLHALLCCTASFKFMVMVHFVTTACFAALPASSTMDCRWGAAYISGTVTSHARAIPLDQGIKLTPSGCLPFSRMSPVGSLCVRILARLLLLLLLILILLLLLLSLLLF